MAISQRHHAPWTELMRRRPLWFGQLQLRQAALQCMKAMAGDEPVVAGTPLQRIIRKRLKLALQSPGWSPAVHRRRRSVTRIRAPRAARSDPGARGSGHR